MNRAFLGIAAGAALLAACETGKTSADLVGTWQRMRDDATLRDQYVFNADGTMTFDEFKPDDLANEDHVTGTYTATDDTIVLEGTDAKDGSRSRYTVTYYANATMFATQALRPTGARTGIVGAWTGTVKLEYPDEPARPAEGVTAIYQFRTDGTWTATGTNADGTSAGAQQGTYVEETPGVFRLFRTGDTVGSTFQMLDDAALVFPTRIFQRR